MGWSYAQEAGKIMNAWKEVCYKRSGSQNQWENKGKTYFFETSRVEHDDGSITGTVWRFLADGVHVRRSGSFKINGDGSIERAPKFLKGIRL